MSLQGIFRFFIVCTLVVTLSVVTLYVIGNERSDRNDGWAKDVNSGLASAELLERGRYLAIAGNCATCHTSGIGGEMAGGVAFETPFGKIYSTNITPDDETGIGGWTDLDFLNAMRFGLRPDGVHLYPAFPYPAFAKMSDEDIAALYGYLQSIPAIRQENQGSELSFPFNFRPLTSVWKALYLDTETFADDSSKSAEWNRGAYLVEGLAHCGACHSPRNLLGAERLDAAMSGGELVDRVRSGESKLWSAPNLTSAPHSLGMWSEVDIAAYLKTGRNAFVETIGPMNEVIMNSTRHLHDGDVNAMATYFSSLPPIASSPRTKADARVLGFGRTVYNLHCGTCHLPTGLGDEKMAPRLAAGSLVVQAENPASLINVILYGPETSVPPLPEKWRKPMEEFQYLLDDQEVAALATFLRNAWGNAGGSVTPDQVAKQR